MGPILAKITEKVNEKLSKIHKILNLDNSLKKNQKIFFNSIF